MSAVTNLQERTKIFSIDIIRFYRRLPKNTEAQIIGKQLLRSGTWVGANTRSAYRGRTSKEFKAKLGIVVEEADECAFWLEILQEAKVFDHKDIDKLKKEANELTAIFISIIKK